MLPTYRFSVPIRFPGFLLASVAAVLFGSAPVRADAPDTCLLLATRNIARGDGDFFLYAPIAATRLTIAKGDVLEYDVYLDKGNPLPVGGIEISTDHGSLYKSTAVDSNHLRAGGDTLLPDAIGRWYRRSIPLDPLVGHSTKRFSAAFQGDLPGPYVQFLDNVVITHADGTRTVVYEGGDPPKDTVVRKEGYSKSILLKNVPRSEVVDGADLTPLFAREMKELHLDEQLEDLREQVDVSSRIAEHENNAAMRSGAASARALLDRAQTPGAMDAQALEGLVRGVHDNLVDGQSVLKKYSGRLVGHAHLDFQWLWSWPETIQASRNTFAQALRFMEEFPGFKFSQSSSALYAATEEHHPDVFKDIQRQVAAGNWEIVGGRIGEADEHMISPESHARHFLYGQRYFREHFGGATATVGWEPDTFGHTWQMPQILLNGGCRYFYFCRGGRGDPMFWWQSPDGSRVLAFDESASGGWYNGEVGNERFSRLVDFADRTDLTDMLWVYGVGNHGGGPTRENIKTAVALQASDVLPTVRFSTATEFFRSVEAEDHGKLPVVDTDLNTITAGGYNGTYTSQSAIKRWNRDAEATTESAEAIATVASRYGFAYPGAELRRTWEDIAWNQHHDTISGTALHSSYDTSESMLGRAIQTSRRIGDAALALLATKIQGHADVVVFNPNAFERDGFVEVDAPDGANAAMAGSVVALLQRSAGGKAVFLATHLPSLGYRSYRIGSAPETPSALSVSADGTVLENAEFKVVLDPARGVVSEIVDKARGLNTLAAGGSGNRLEIHWEEPRKLNAWVIGAIRKVEPLVGPVQLAVLESGPARVTVAFDRQFQSTTLHQKISLPAVGAPQFELATEWKELGGDDRLSPFLKVAFDVAADHPRFVTQIPFGNIEKPNDNSEVPALTFADLAGAAGGAALINDSKHGYSASGNTMRLSLIRSSYHPDPRPNDRPQLARWSFLPHAGDWADAGVLQKAQAFNHPVWTAKRRPGADASLPGEMSFLAFAASDVIVTGVKKAEDDDDVVVRFYEAFGKPSSAILKTPWKVTKSRRVNFIEDPVDSRAGDDLRAYEIRTLKLTVAR